MRITILAILATFTTFSPAKAEPDLLIKAQWSDQVHYYCYASSDPYGERYWFSSPFAADSAEYHVGITNSYYAFVNARHTSEPIDATCMGPYPTYRDAEDELNRHMGRSRQDGKSVTMTWWTYRS